MIVDAIIAQYIPNAGMVCEIDRVSGARVEGEYVFNGRVYSAAEWEDSFPDDIVVEDESYPVLSADSRNQVENLASRLITDGKMQSGYYIVACVRSGERYCEKNVILDECLIG